MKSEMDVRHGGSKSVLITNLIVHRCVVNISDQTIQLIRIPHVVEKALNPPLVCQRLEFLENISQLPDDPYLSASALDFGERGLTVPASFSFLAP